MMKNQPKTRNYIAVAAHMRNSAGSHDPAKKQKNKKDRKETKKTLRSLYY